LLDRPIIFTPFDLEDYLKNDRELYYPYEDVTPGPIANNWSEVMKYIEEAIKYPDKYREQRQKVRDLFFQYVDGNSSKRVVDAIYQSIS
jgi:CDP-glycerol glycerophosphotransferase (TagB/SpsB family)